MKIPTTEYHKTKVNKVNQGTYFKLKPTETAPVWIRGEYDRSSKSYSCYKYDDVKSREVPQREQRHIH